MIREAFISDHIELTEIAFLAKQGWDYPAGYIEIWKDELTVTQDYIRENAVFVFEQESQVIGFISLVENKQEKTVDNVLIETGFWMDHLFIHPDFQKMGIGKLLTEYLINFCRKSKISSLYIFVDPNAVGFYEKFGAKFVRMSKSSIPDRELPVFVLNI